MTADCLPCSCATGPAVWSPRCTPVGAACWPACSNRPWPASMPRHTTCWSGWGRQSGPTAFEVGDEVRDAFVAEDRTAAACFTANRTDHWLADLYALARLRLRRLGIESVYGGDHCTYSDGGRFFSYRRDGVTGRMASLIWLQPETGGQSDD